MSVADTSLTLSVDGSIELLQRSGKATRRTVQGVDTSLSSGGVVARKWIDTRLVHGC